MCVCMYVLLIISYIAHVHLLLMFICCSCLFIAHVHLLLMFICCSCSFIAHVHLLLMFICCSCSFIAHVHLLLMFICCLCPFAQAKDIKDNGSLCLWNLDCVLSCQRANFTYMCVFILQELGMIMAHYVYEIQTVFLNCQRANITYVSVCVFLFCKN